VKIYTRSGDKGQTSLIYGRRIEKDALRVQAYGTIDEANSVLGLAISLLPNELESDEPVFDSVRKACVRVQRDLFDVGRDLATPEDKRDGYFIGQSDVDVLEALIDTFDAELPSLTRFVLPGGHPAAAAFHHARTVARTAERLVVSVQKEESLSPHLTKYMNRLSDLLFVFARIVNHRTHTEEPGVDFQAEKPSPFSDAK
jgi:cob(I)alamin adenosyltransferase